MAEVLLHRLTMQRVQRGIHVGEESVGPPQIHFRRRQARGDARGSRVAIVAETGWVTQDGHDVFVPGHRPEVPAIVGWMRPVDGVLCPEPTERRVWFTVRVPFGVE